MEKEPEGQAGSIPNHPSANMEQPSANNPPPYFPEQYAQPHPMFAQPTLVQIHPIVLGKYATRMNCPHCGADILTKVQHQPGNMTHIAALVLCLVCFPLVCVPYCIDDCQDAEHECPNCNRFLGRSRA